MRTYIAIIAYTIVANAQFDPTPPTPLPPLPNFPSGLSGISDKSGSNGAFSGVPSGSHNSPIDQSNAPHKRESSQLNDGMGQFNSPGFPFGNGLTINGQPVSNQFGQPSHFGPPGQFGQFGQSGQSGLVGKFGGIGQIPAQPNMNKRSVDKGSTSTTVDTAATGSGETTTASVKVKRGLFDGEDQNAVTPTTGPAISDVPINSLNRARRSVEVTSTHSTPKSKRSVQESNEQSISTPSTSTLISTLATVTPVVGHR